MNEQRIPDSAADGTCPFRSSGVSDPHMRVPILEGDVDGLERPAVTERQTDRLMFRNRCITAVVVYSADCSVDCSESR